MQVLPLPCISATIQTQKKNLCLDYIITPMMNLTPTKIGW